VRRGALSPHFGGWWGTPKARGMRPLFVLSGQGLKAMGLGTKILIVEDSAEMRNLLERILSKNYLPFSTTSGMEAMELARRENFAITLLASRVLRREGHALLSSLKALNPDTRIVVVTDYPADPLLTQLNREEIYAFLSRPFTIREILDLIGRSISEA